MGKMKVHELAKELNMQSKELVDKLIELKYDVKSHMSTLEDNEVEKIKKQLKGGKIKEQSKKEKKVATPVIIRREVTRVESNENKKENNIIRREDRDDLGVVQRRTDTSMNIKYRTPARKIGPISSNKNEEKKVVEEILVKQEMIEKQEEVKNDVKNNIINDEIKNEGKAPTEPAFNSDAENNNSKPTTDKFNKENSEQRLSNTENKNDEQKSFNRDNRNGEQRPFNRDNRNGEQSPFNRDNRNGEQRPFNRDNRNGEQRPFNRDNRNNEQRPFNRDNRNNEQRPFNRDNRNGEQRPFNRDNRNSEQRPFNRDNRNSEQRPFNRDNRNSEQRPFNRDNRNNGPRPFNRDGNRPFNNQNRQDKRVDKDIKDIITTTENETKDLARENVRTAYKDKQKDSRKFEEENKKVSKTRGTRNNDEEINFGKLKDLQSESKLSNMFDDTESKIFDYYDLSKSKRNKKGNKRKPTESKNHLEQKIFELTDIEIPESVTVKELAEKLKKQSSEVIKKLLGYGVLATLNNELDFDTAYLVAGEFGITAHKKDIVSDEEILFDDTDDNEDELVARPPIVVVMGHVDHGKTSLLDAIRSTSVSEHEAGGITQHIGAYKVKVNNREITFLDTPGHEAFTAMRARGAQVTDIAIIIVAADDGIMPQTVEAINHAKAAGVSIIVAINKIDKEGANIDKIKEQLTEYGLVPEEWGGDTICVPISAKQHKNIDSLLEMVLLVADMKNLRTNPNKQSKGTIIEARLDKNIGIVASVIVQRGTLNIGDTIVVGSVIGKIRSMTDDKGQKIKMAGPSTPVEIVGLPEVPDAGEIFYEVENEKVAKHLIEKRKSKLREDMIRKNAPVTLDNLFNQIEAGKLRDLNIIVKADVQGSVQAIRQSLEKIQNEEARVRIIHANVGAITESDVTLAKVTNSIIIGFNVRPDNMAKSIADKENVEIKLYSVIYNAIDDITAALKGMLKPKYKEVIQGTAEVRQVFKITNVGMIAGCYVLEGKIVRNSGVRVLRDNVVIHEGKLTSLKREKDDAKDVATGYECGVQVEDYNDIKVGDHVESFIMEEIK